MHLPDEIDFDVIEAVKLAGTITIPLISFICLGLYRVFLKWDVHIASFFARSRPVASLITYIRKKGQEMILS